MSFLIIIINQVLSSLPLFSQITTNEAQVRVQRAWLMISMLLHWKAQLCMWWRIAFWLHYISFFVNGVILDCELFVKKHIGKVARACYFHLRCLKTLRHTLSEPLTVGLVTAFVISWLDYCNSMLAVLPKSSIVPLPRVQIAATGLIRALGSDERATPYLLNMHWPFKLFLDAPRQ